MKAQSWLDETYLEKEKDDVLSIETKEGSIINGNLIIEGFKNLKKIWIEGDPLLFNEENVRDLRNVFLNNREPGAEKKISLQIKNLPSLIMFRACDCQLVNITIENCPNISYFCVKNNSLSSLDFLKNISLQTLTYLDIKRNNFSPNNLGFFAKFVNLKELRIGFNRFCGSLELLKDLNKLKYLSISDTDVDSGLEYLPESVETVMCAVSPISLTKRKVRKIYLSIGGSYENNFKKWQETSPEILRQKIKKLISEKQCLTYQLSNLEVLKTEAERLVEEGKKEKEKIISNYKKYEQHFRNLNNVLEEDSLQKLIKVHEVYERTKKEGKFNPEFKKKFDTIYYQIADKLDNKFIEMIGKILNSFEQLYENEWRFKQYSVEIESIKEKKKELEIKEKAIKDLQEEIIKTLKDNPAQLIKKITKNIIGISTKGGNVSIGGNFSVEGEIISSGQVKKAQTIVEKQVEELCVSQQLHYNPSKP